MSTTETETGTDANGKATAEDLAATALKNEGEPEEQDDDEVQMTIPGTAPRLSLSAGGDRPTSAAVVLRGGSIPVEGQFEKGETIHLWVEAKVAEVAFVDRHDKHGTVEGTTRKHVARIIGVDRSQVVE